MATKRQPTALDAIPHDGLCLHLDIAASQPDDLSSLTAHQTGTLASRIATLIDRSHDLIHTGNECTCLHCRVILEAVAMLNLSLMTLAESAVPQASASALHDRLMGLVVGMLEHAYATAGSTENSEKTG